jgi:pimeloyl-ACP methyl ester carboxylesterase
MHSSTAKAKWRKILLSAVCLLLAIVIGVFIYGGHSGFNLGIDSAKSSTDDLNLCYDEETQATFAKLESTAADFNSLNYETMQIESEDGLTLTGYFVPAETESDKLAVLAHGFSMNAKNTGNIAVYLHAQGFNVFAADARAHGASEGRYRGMGWLDRKDYLKWLDVLIKKLGSDTQIVMHQ